MLLPSPWRAAFGAAKPYKIGSMQPLTGVAAAGGKTALVGIQMAADRINKMGGINGRPVDLIVADDQSKPDIGRRAVEKLVGRGQHRRACRRLPVEYLPRLHAGLGGPPAGQHDRRLPRHDADHQLNATATLSAPSTMRRPRRSRLRPIWSRSSARNGTSSMPTMPGASRPATPTPPRSRNRAARSSAAPASRSAPPTRRRSCPRSTAISTGCSASPSATDGVTLANQLYDLGLTKKYKWAGDGAIAESTNLPALGNKIEGFVGINRYLPVFDPPLDTPANHKFFDDAVARLKKIDPSGPLPDRYIAVELRGHERLEAGHREIGFPGPRRHAQADRGARRSRDEGGRRFPQGDKTLRKEDHQAFLREFCS